MYVQQNYYLYLLVVWNPGKKACNSISHGHVTHLDGVTFLFETQCHFDEKDEEEMLKFQIEQK